MDRRAALAAVAIGFVFLVMGLMERAPDHPTETQAARASLRADQLWHHAWKRFGVTGSYPHLYWNDPADYGKPNAIALAYCEPRNIIVMEPTRAARRFGELLDDTLPHEIAHLVSCEVGADPDNRNHGPAFQRVLIDLKRYTETLP